jgi:hypothetical protein
MKIIEKIHLVIYGSDDGNPICELLGDPVIKSFDIIMDGQIECSPEAIDVSIKGLQEFKQKMFPDLRLARP